MLDQPVVDGGEQGVAGRAQLLAGGVRGVHRAEDLGGARGPVGVVGLPRAEPVDVEAGDVDVRPTGRDPVREHPPEAAGGEDADRVHACRDEVVADARGLSDRGGQVGRERLRPAEERADAHLEGDRDAGHGLLQERAHPVPVGWDLAEGEVARDARHLPRRRLRLEQADHHPAPFLAEVAVRGGVLEHRRVGTESVDRVGDQVVVLGRLVGDDQAVPRPELAGPHAGAVDDVLGLDVGGLARCARGDPDPAHACAVGEHVLDRDALDDPHPQLPGALGQGGGDVDGVDPAVAGDVEAGEQVVGLRPGEQVCHLPRRDLLDLEPEVPLERGDPAVLLQAIRVGGRLDEADRLEPGGLPGLLLESRVQVARVQPDRGRGLRRRPEAGHQACGVPRGAAGEAVALEQDHVGPAGVGEVVGDGAADHTSADHDDAGTVGELCPG